MATERMDIEVAEKQLKSLEHSEQHYFNRQVTPRPGLHTLPVDRALMLTVCASAITTMVSGIPSSSADLEKVLANHCDPAIRHP